MQNQATALVRRALGAIPNPREGAFDYDRNSDLLLIHFTPGPQPATAIQIADPAADVYVVLHRGTDQEEALAAAEQAHRQEPPGAAVTHVLERLIAWLGPMNVIGSTLSIPVR